MNYNQKKKLFSEILKYPANELDKDCIIDIDQFRKLCSYGIPDVSGYRALSWKILLRNIPLDKREWNSQLAKNRSSYYGFVKDLVSEENLKFPLTEDYKYNNNDNEDLKLIEQIDMDVRRTLADHAFFQLPVYDSLSNVPSPTKHTFGGMEQPIPFENISGHNRRFLFSYINDGKIDIRKRPNNHRRTQSNLEFKSISNFNNNNTSPYHYDDLSISPASTNEPNTPPTEEVNNNGEIVDLHWEAMERILYIYAKLNPGISYVQGMNEILGPLYYVCANDTDILLGKQHAEADAFYLFTSVMGSIRDQYLKQLDRDARVGVNATLKLLQSKLVQVCPELYNNLKNKSLEPTFYAFRWITLLGSQEFNLPDVIVLWDTLFSHTPLYYNSENGFPSFENGSNISPLNSMVMVSVAMLCLVKDKLMIDGFADNLKLLQNYPKNINIHNIVDLAYKLEALPPNCNFNLIHLLPTATKPTIMLSSSLSNVLPGFHSLLNRGKKIMNPSWKQHRSSLSNSFINSWNNTLNYLSNQK